MGIRGELYTTEVVLDNRSYFFNVKENRNGDIFLQIVESKKATVQILTAFRFLFFRKTCKKFLVDLILP